MVTAKKTTTTKAAVAQKTASAVPEAPVKKPPAARKKAAPKVATAPQAVVSDEQRTRYIEVAAFYIAERRGFAAGNPNDDWLAAAAEVDRLIASGHFPA